MIVYMLLNTVTEQCYIGATDKSLEERWQRHLKDARGGSEWPLHHAMREWSEEYWDRVVLSNCYTLQELSAAETAWRRRCHADEPRVGYNDPKNATPYATTVENGQKGGDPLVVGGEGKRSPLRGMTSEQRREYFRECGRRGAAKSRAMMGKAT